MSHISHDLKSVEDLLKGDLQYKVPKYQRKYDWKAQEAQDLLDDLADFNGTEERLYLGTMILARDNSNPKIREIVDGQQRLTTIMLLLLSFRMRLLELKLPDRAENIRTLLHHMQTATGISRGLRLLTSESICDAFEYFQAKDWDGVYPDSITVTEGTKKTKKPIKAQTQRLRPVLDLFRRAVAKMDEKTLTAYLENLLEAQLLILDVEKSIDALSIFERTNARGKDLEVGDLIKNYLYAEDVPSIDDEWTTISRNAGSTMPRMLKYLYVSQLGYISKPKLYKELKKLAKSMGPDQFTNEARLFSEFYALTRDPQRDKTQQVLKSLELTVLYSNPNHYETLCRSLQGLKLFSVTQATPVIYSSLSAMKSTPPDQHDKCAKAIASMVDAIEKFHFTNNAILNLDGNDVERLYAQAAADFAQGGDLAIKIRQFIQELAKKQQQTNLATFVEKFSQLDYEKSERGIIKYVFDRINNKGLSSGERAALYDPNEDDDSNKSTFTIEHFLPQNPSAGTTYDKETDAAKHNIGNLFVIERRFNGKLNNKSPKEKIALMTGELSQHIQVLGHVRSFIAEYGNRSQDWDKTMIRERAKSLASSSYNEVWRIKA